MISTVSTEPLYPVGTVSISRIYGTFLHLSIIYFFSLWPPPSRPKGWDGLPQTIQCHHSGHTSTAILENYQDKKHPYIATASQAQYLSVIEIRNVYFQTAYTRSPTCLILGISSICPLCICPHFIRPHRDPLVLEGTQTPLPFEKNLLKGCK